MLAINDPEILKNIQVKDFSHFVDRTDANFTKSFRDGAPLDKVVRPISNKSSFLFEIISVVGKAAQSVIRRSLERDPVCFHSYFHIWENENDAEVHQTRGR